MPDQPNEPQRAPRSRPLATVEPPTLAASLASPPTQGVLATAKPPTDTPTQGGDWLDALGLAEGGLLADVGVILDLASIYLPLIGPVFSPAVPTPFVLLVLRRGPRVTLLAAVVAAFLVTVMAGPHYGWRMGLEAIVGLLIGWAMRRRIRPTIALALGTLLVALVTFCAALGVIFLVGLPIADVVMELRNALVLMAATLATGAHLIGADHQWLALRPTLATLGKVALRFWPVLLFLYGSVFALLTVTLYYTVANLTVRVLGYPVRPFPPLWVARLVRLSIVLAMAPVLVPVTLWHGVGTLTRRARRGGRR